MTRLRRSRSLDALNRFKLAGLDCRQKLLVVPFVLVGRVEGVVVNPD